MGHTLFTLIVALIIALSPTLHTSSFEALPSLVVTNVEAITVRFELGAVWACTVFEQQDIAKTPLRDGSVYAPRRCWALSTDMDSYEDNWDYIRRFETEWLAWASISYPDTDEAMRRVETNKVPVHR